MSTRVGRPKSALEILQLLLKPATSVQGPKLVEKPIVALAEPSTTSTRARVFVGQPLLHSKQPNHPMSRVSTAHSEDHGVVVEKTDATVLEFAERRSGVASLMPRETVQVGHEAVLEELGKSRVSKEYVP